MADENQMRIELQMALDSKDSDIEQLRNTLQTLSVQSMDTASVCSGPEMDTDDAYTGSPGTPPGGGRSAFCYQKTKGCMLLLAKARVGSLSGPKPDFESEGESIPPLRRPPKPLPQNE